MSVWRCRVRGHRFTTRRGTGGGPRILPCPDRAQDGRGPPDLAGWQHDRLFRDNRRLGEQPFRPGGLAGGGRRRALPADPYGTGEQARGHRWSPDGSRLGFVADRGDGAQVYLIPPGGGEAERLTSHEHGVGAFRFSPDGTRIAFAATDPAPDAFEEREETLRQLRCRRRRFPHDAPLGGGRAGGRRAPPPDSGGRLHRRVLRMVAGWPRDRLRPHADTAGQLLPAFGHLRRGRRPREPSEPSPPLPAPSAGRCGRPKARTSSTPPPRARIPSTATPNLP